MAKETLEARFDREHGEDEGVLRAARRCAQLSKPWLLPDPEQQHDQSLPQNYQSLGARGLTASAGQIVQVTAPIDTPWYHIVPKATVRYGNVAPEALAEVEQAMFVRSLLGQAMLEAASIPEDGRMPISLRMALLINTNQALGTGDSLMRLDDDYRLTCYRRDRYSTRRGTDCQVLSHMIRETIDPLSLREMKLAQAKIDQEEAQKKNPHERQMPLTTLVEYHPQTRKWVIRQEINKKKIVESEEPCTPYFGTPYELVAGEHYGRGLIDLNKGDLASFDELSERLLDFAAMASKMIPVIDPSSDLTPDDMLKKSGVPLIDRVVDGKPQNFGFASLNKLNDFNVVATVRNEIRKDLGAALLIQSEMVRDSERTTKFEVQEVTIRELQSRLAGFLTVHEAMAGPLARRTDYQLVRDKLVRPFSDKVDFRILTGLSALTYAAKAAKLMTLVEVYTKLGEATASRLELDYIADAYLRYQGIYEPLAVKSPEKAAAERAQAMEEAMKAAAAQKVIDTAGNVIENKLTTGAIASA